MKAIITLVTVTAFSFALMANGPKEHPEKYCAKLKDGIKTIVHQGAPITADVTLSNGTKIQPDGTIIKKDGTRTMLQEGECINKDGIISKENAKKNKSKVN